MLASPKSVLSSNVIADFDKLITCELDQFVASRAVQMIMLWVSIIVFVNGSPTQLKAIQQARVNKLLKGPVNGRTRNIIGLSFGGQLLHELVRIEMLMPVEDPFQQKLALPRISQPFALKVFLKTL
jgi:hypothetical protein